jgi:hypothetical protein
VSRKQQLRQVCGLSQAAWQGSVPACDYHPRRRALHGCFLVLALTRQPLQAGAWGVRWRVLGGGEGAALWLAWGCAGARVRIALCLHVACQGAACRTPLTPLFHLGLRPAAGSLDVVLGGVLSRAVFGRRRHLASAVCGLRHVGWSAAQCAATHWLHAATPVLDFPVPRRFASKPFSVCRSVCVRW